MKTTSLKRTPLYVIRTLIPVALVSVMKGFDSTVISTSIKRSPLLSGHPLLSPNEPFLLPCPVLIVKENH